MSRSSVLARSGSLDHGCVSPARLSAGTLARSVTMLRVFAKRQKHARASSPDRVGARMGGGLAAGGHCCSHSVRAHVLPVRVKLTRSERRHPRRRTRTAECESRSCRAACPPVMDPLVRHRSGGSLIRRSRLARRGADHPHGQLRRAPCGRTVHRADGAHRGEFLPAAPLPRRRGRSRRALLSGEAGPGREASDTDVLADGDGASVGETEVPGWFGGVMGHHQEEGLAPGAHASGVGRDDGDLREEVDDLV